MTLTALPDRTVGPVRDGVPLWMARRLLVNFFHNLKNVSDRWVWLTLILLGTLAVAIVIAGIGTALRPLAERWPTAFFAVSTLLVAVGGARRAMTVLG